MNEKKRLGLGFGLLLCMPKHNGEEDFVSFLVVADSWLSLSRPPLPIHVCLPIIFHVLSISPSLSKCCLYYHFLADMRGQKEGDVLPDATICERESERVLSQVGMRAGGESGMRLESY